MAMPAALDVPWEAVKTLAIAVGVREAARQCGIGEDAVRQRSAREGWLKDLPRSQPLPPTMLQSVTGVTKPSDVIANYSGNTRLKLALVADKQAENLAVRDPDELVLMASTVKTVIDGAAKLHGWETGAQVTVNFDLISENLHSIPIVDAP